jgi:protein phosphatase
MAHHSIYCPNPLCQAENSVEQRSCQACGTTIPHHYLWLPNPAGMAGSKTGELIVDRYLVLKPQILLDTKPSHTPIFINEVDDQAIRYAELFPYRSQIPQIYGYIQLGEEFYELLENNAIYPSEAATDTGKSLSGQLMPEIATLWDTAPFEQQLAWMYQICHLWQPLGRLGLTETLLQPDLVRIDGDVVHLLNLESDQTSNPALSDFAIVWGDLLNWANDPFWIDLAQKMIQGEIVNSDQILGLLDQAISMIHKPSGSKSFDVDIATLTNRGPSRSENQDACHPPSESSLKRQSLDQPWLVVCDGIGGHEGGSLASKLAITAIEQYLTISDLSQCSSEELETHLEKAIFAANDVICDRNDRENRQAKQRMGTTAVLVYVRRNQLFVTHVGDSRAYRMTHSGCRQVTVDDDLASREAIYGSAFYREALQYPGTGALTQALGMAESTQLQPTTQRFWLTEACIFLVCSDGLSDFDLVDRIWSNELKPALRDRSKLFTACQNLVNLANEQNGHDNVTVGLLQVTPSLATTTPPTVSTVATQVAVARTAPRPPVTSTTRIAPPQRRSHWLPISLSGLVLLGLVGGVGFAWWRSRSVMRSQPPIVTSPTIEINRTPIVWVEAETLQQIQQVNQILQVKPGPVPLSLLPAPDRRNLPEPATIGKLAPGTIVQVTEQLTINAQENWLKLKVCTVPSEAQSLPEAALSPGVEGWQAIGPIAAQVTLPSPMNPTAIGNCASPVPPSPPTVVPPADSPTPLPSPPNQAQ